jgi:acyl-CoA thioesterase-2
VEAPPFPSADEVQARLLDLICPEPLGDDRFAIDISDRVSGHLFGGLVAAQGLHAAITTVSPERRVHSVHAYFLRRGRPELPLSFVVDRDADGGSFSARRVTVEQEGRAIFSMAASFHQPEPTAEVLAPQPDAITVDESVPWDADHHLDGCLEVRQAVAAPAPDGLRSGRVWVRIAGPLPDDDVLHDCLQLYLSDLGTPWNVVAPLGLGVMVSLDHAVWFHRHARMDRWHYIELEPHAVADARGLYSGRMWELGGAQVMSIAQECLLRPPL